MFRIPHSVPAIPHKALSRIEKAINSGWLTSGPVVKEFEAALCERTNAKHAICTSSCTAALTVALKSVTDKYFTGEHATIKISSFTYLAAGNAVFASGRDCSSASFIDCNPKTLTAERPVTTNEKSRIWMITTIAGKRSDTVLFSTTDQNEFIVEDSAQGIPDMRDLENWVSCMSFWPSKIITTGEGGCILTNEDKIADHCRLLINQGCYTGPLPWNRKCAIPSYNFKMSDINACLGVAQMETLDNVLVRRMLAVERYKENLRQHLAVLGLNFQESVNSDHQMLIIMVDKKYRDGLVQHLRAMDIEATVHFDPPLHRQPAFNSISNTNNDCLVNTEAASETVVTLPLFPAITEAEIDEVCLGVTNFLERNHSEIQ